MCSSLAGRHQGVVYKAVLFCNALMRDKILFNATALYLYSSLEAGHLTTPSIHRLFKDLAKVRL